MRITRTHTNTAFMINFHCTNTFSLPAQHSRTSPCSPSAPGSEADFPLITIRSSVSSTRSAIAGAFLQVGYADSSSFLQFERRMDSNDFSWKFHKENRTRAQSPSCESVNIILFIERHVTRAARENGQSRTGLNKVSVVRVWQQHRYYLSTIALDATCPRQEVPAKEDLCI